MTESIWSRSAQLPRFSPLDGDIKTDVLIAGGGLCGLLCAFKLAERGIPYVLVEAASICSGITKNTTAKITAQHGLIYRRLVQQFGRERARMYLDANISALDAYRSLAASIPCDFAETDSYVYSLNRVDGLESELKALEQIGCSAAFENNLPLPFPVAGSVRFSKQAQFDPLKFAAGLAKDLRVYEHTAVHEIRDGVAYTSGGRIQAKRFIVSTHFPFINKHGLYFMKLYQQRSYVLALKNAQDVDGMYVDEAENGLSLRNAGEQLLLGGCGHRTGKQGGGWRELGACAARLYPGAHETGRWATQDCMTLDGVPYIGPYAKGAQNVYVATGFNKWGMTSSMAAASILCDLLTDRKNPYAPVFSPSRTILRPQLCINLLESGLNLLTPARKRCPHLGCALKWNEQERSWDCPCHGSRFTEHGKLIDNPAKGDLPN